MATRSIFVCATALAALAACGSATLPEVSIDTPLADVSLGSAPAPAPADACLVVSGSLDGGQIVIGPGFRCADIGRPTNNQADRDVAPPVGGEPGPDAGLADERPQPGLAATIREAEGEIGNFPYCDSAGLHVGDGIHIGRYLSDREREGYYCEAIENARAEAERVIGDAWADLSRPRRDVMIELCYWSACAGFVEMIPLVREGRYVEAASEIMDSCLYRRLETCPRESAPNPDRAMRLVRDMVSGERGG